MELTFQQKENVGFQYILEVLSPCSPYGAERIKNLCPYSPKQTDLLQTELDNLQRVLEQLDDCDAQITELMVLFMRTKDVTKTLHKCSAAALGEVELFELKRFLILLSQIVPLYCKLNSKLGLSGINMVNTDRALDLLDPDRTRIATFHISDSYSKSLRAIRKSKREAEEQIRRADTAPRKEELLALRSKIAAEEEHEEKRIREKLSEALRPFLSDILENAQSIASIDLLVQKAKLAKQYGAVKPVLTKNRLLFENLVNPYIASLLMQRNKRFTPISIALESGATVITGANMGGKSVALKTIALNVFLFQCGFFPFASHSELPLFDELNIIAEDMQSLDRGLSSFGAEIVQLNHLVERNKQSFCLNILDEFARGTNPDEGAAIMCALTTYLNQSNSVSLLATHYDNVAGKGNAHYQVIGLRDLDIARLTERIRQNEPSNGIELIAQHMNYGLFKVSEKENCPKDALNICKMLALDKDILDIIEKNY